MGLNFKLIQRVAKTTTRDVSHSSGYAAAQSGAAFGASGGDTFADRRQIDHNRKLVQGYRNARIAQGVPGMPRPKTYAEEKRLAELKKTESARAKSKDHAHAQIKSQPAPKKSLTAITPPKWRSW